MHFRCRHTHVTEIDSRLYCIGSVDASFLGALHYFSSRADSQGTVIAVKASDAIYRWIRQVLFCDSRSPITSLCKRHLEPTPLQARPHTHYWPLLHRPTWEFN